MLRRTSRVIVLALLAACSLQVTSTTASRATEFDPISSLYPSRDVQPAAKPNVVMLMLDDYAAADHRILERLPNINALFLERGMEALNYWGNDPLCCPGRANFLTAQNAHHSGVVRNDARLLDPRETIATELHSVGYYTNICGKYLNKTNRLADKSPQGWDNVAIMPGGYYRYTAYVNDRAEYHDSAVADYSTDVFASHCVKFLQAAPSAQPVFMFMTPYTTHKGSDRDGTIDRFEAPPAPRHRRDSRCSSIPRWMPENYNSANLSDKPAYMRKRPLLPDAMSNGLPLIKKCRALLSVDEWLGRVVATLKAQGRFDNTLFILTADNGMGWGSFRWQHKVAPHTAQISLFMNWPAKMAQQSPTQQSELLMNVDLAPTICELAGCEMGPYFNGYRADGQSFAGLIAPAISSAVPVRDSVILEQRGNSVTPIWRAIMTNPQTHSLGDQWFYIWYKTEETELYEISSRPCYAWQPSDPGDPCMLRNLTRDPKYASVKSTLAAELAATW